MSTKPGVTAASSETKGTEADREVVKSVAGGWPFHYAHRDAHCVFCGEPLRNLSPTRNAPGSGTYRGECRLGCGFTWYDCAEGPVPMIQVNERREIEEALR